jgi:hypothetical protein
MNSWLVWGGFGLAVIFLGWVAYHFTVRTLRFLTLALVVAAVVPVTRYGVTRSFPASPGAPVDLVNGFTRGLDNLSSAFFQPLLPGPDTLVPGRVGWIVIVVFLAFAYRELEVWAMRWQPPTVDTSALGGGQPGTQNGGGQAEPGDRGPDEQHEYDNLVAELRFRLPAVEVRAPPVVPGGSTPSGLASIAENSDVQGSGLAGAIIRFVGMLWPNPRRYQVRVWVKCLGHPAAVPSEGRSGHGDPPYEVNGTADGSRQTMAGMRVTVDLEDARTGGCIATKTLAARNVEDAAARVAAYVARQIFREDPTVPPWSIGSFDGSDLAALLRAKQQPELVDCPDDAHRARCRQIDELEKAVCKSPGAGIARYELALLYDLEGRHTEALWLHAINREQYPRFFRGRYRLGMSLEMIANPEFWPWDKEAADKLGESLDILDRCRVTSGVKRSISAEKLSTALRGELLAAAMDELSACRRQVTLWRLIWEAFRHRDERAMRKPYWRLRERQRFHDAVFVAELLVVVRQRMNEKECERLGKDRPQASKVRPSAKRAMRIIAAFAGDTTAIETLLAPVEKNRPSDSTEEKPPGPAKEKWRPVKNAGKTRWLPWQHRTPSWQAAYNAACLYAALACSKRRQSGENGLQGLIDSVIDSLERVVNDRHCDMERPWDWISTDPDLCCLYNVSEFREFVRKQGEKDYPRANFRPTATGTGWPAIPMIRQLGRLISIRWLTQSR